MVNGKSGLQVLFNHCLHQTVFEGRTMHEAMLEDNYMNEDGYSVLEGMVELPANTPLHFLSMASQCYNTDKFDMVLFKHTDYASLMQQWATYLGGFSETQFTITQATSRPYEIYYEGDMEYEFTVESPVLEAPITVKTLTGNSRKHYKNKLTDALLEVFVKTDSGGSKWTLENVLEDELGLAQSSINYTEGTYPYTKAIKPKEEKPQAFTPNLDILPDLVLSPDVIRRIQQSGDDVEEVRVSLERYYADTPWEGVVIEYIKPYIFKDIDLRTSIDHAPDTVRFAAIASKGGKEVDFEKLVDADVMEGNIRHQDLQLLLANYVEAAFDQSVKEHGFALGVGKYLLSLKQDEDAKKLLNFLATSKLREPKKATPRKPKMAK